MISLASSFLLPLLLGDVVMVVEAGRAAERAATATAASASCRTPDAVLVPCAHKSGLLTTPVMLKSQK